MTDETWSNPEIVRAVVALTAAVEKLTARIDALGSEYVSKELYEVHNAAHERRIDLIAEEQVNLAADLSRHHRDHGSTWEKWLPPMVTGLVVAVVAFALTQLK